MANHYIRNNASGANDGTDWTNAFTAVPASLIRGDTYYISGGSGASYGTYFADDNESTTVRITLKKATVADHGTGTGWADIFASPMVWFDDFIAQRDYYTIDGAHRGVDISDPTGYGMRINGALVSHNDTFPPGADHWIVQYCDIGGVESAIYDAGIPNDAIDLVNISGTATVTGWEIRNCRIHNARIGITLLAADGMLIEGCYFTRTFGKEAIIGLGSAKNIVVRNNIFYNTCRDDPDDPGSNGATAEIAAWNSSTPGDFDNWEIYGNIVYNDMLINHSDGVVLIGGNGATWAGVGTTGTKVYNNTFAGIEAGVTNIQINGTGNFCYNNLGYDLAGAFSPNCDTEASNGEALSDPFVNYATGDFHLTASISGTSLGAGFSSTDPDGVTRGTGGIWDRGTFQFAGVAPPEGVLAKLPTLPILPSLPSL